MNPRERAWLYAAVLSVVPSCGRSDYSLGVYALPPWPDAGWPSAGEDAGVPPDAGDAGPSAQAESRDAAVPPLTGDAGASADGASADGASADDASADDASADDASADAEPLQVANTDALVLWLRADVGIESSDDGLVVSWTDTLTGNVATAPSVEARPRFVADDPPALSFDGNDEFELPPLAALSSFTFLAVVAAEEQPNCPSILHFSNRGSDQSTTDELEFGRHMGTWYYETGTSYLTAPPGAFAAGSAHRLAVVQHEGGLAELFVDGVLVSSGTVPQPASVIRSSNFVGNSHWERSIDGSCLPFVGRIFELMFFSRVLPEAERGANDDYLAERWSAALMP